MKNKALTVETEYAVQVKEDSMWKNVFTYAET